MSERSPLLSTDGPSTFTTDVRTNVKQRKSIGNTSTTQQPSLFKGFLIAASLFVLILVLTFGVSIITTTQSSVARDLHVTTGASWLTSTYLIAATSLTPIAGKLCKIFSMRWYLLVSTLIQSAGLLLTAFAGSLWIFILGRIICGVGSASVTPVTFLAVTELTPVRYWGFFFGLINCAYTSGLALGAVVGGALDPLIGWRAVFWVQVPVCLAAGLVAFLTIPTQSGTIGDSNDEEMTLSQKVASIDYLGVVTLVGTIVAVLYTLASTKLELTAVMIAIGLAALFSINESRWTAEPIIPPTIICSRAMALTCIATLGFMCARWEVLFYTPTYGIAVLGWNQSQSGFLLIPTNLGFAFGSVVIGVLHITESRSYYISCLVCFVLFVLEHFALSCLVIPKPSIWLLVSALFANGFIAGGLLNYSLAHLLFLTRRSHHVIVIPLLALFRSLSGSFGSALSGGIFVRSLQESLQTGFRDKGIFGKDELIAQLLSRPLLVQRLHGAEREVAMTSYSTSIRYLVMISCTWVIAMLLIQAGTGWTGPEGEPVEDSERRGSTTTDIASIT